MLKEGRKLVLCIRDTPFNRIHVENMLRAAAGWRVIMPVIPAFYDQPKTIDELVTQYTCRVLSQIGLPQRECTAGWGALHRRKRRREGHYCERRG